MERRGSGFKKILADYEGQVEFDETKMPVFDADNDDFTLTLYNLNYGTNYATQVNENVIENVIEISEEKIKKIMPGSVSMTLCRKYSISSPDEATACT